MRRHKWTLQSYRALLATQRPPCLLDEGMSDEPRCRCYYLGVVFELLPLSSKPGLGFEKHGLALPPPLPPRYVPLPWPRH